MSPPEDQSRTSRPALEAFLSHDRGDGRELTDRLFKEFGSLGDALAAPASRLADTIGDAPARQLRSFRALAEAALSERVSARPWVPIEEMATFLNFTIGYLPVELFHAFFLDSAGCVIRSETLARGSPTSARVSARDLMVRAVELGSTALVVGHNHPSGMVRPSCSDIDFTARIERLADDLEMRLIDHLIVARGMAFSIKRNAAIDWR